MTLAELIDQAEAKLLAANLSYGHGTTNARDEAIWLTFWKLGIPLDVDLDTIGSQTIDAPQADTVMQLMEERISTRKPAAYLTREAWLQGVPFYIDERSIVPRSFIAELIADESIDGWLSDQTRDVLDLCTGNGSLAVLAAMAWPDVRVTGADISTDALEVARINVERHQLQDRISLIQSDGLGACPGPYDLVLCNPPYVNASSMSKLPAEYLAEPELALAGGTDGMDFIRRLLRDLPAKMSHGAVLVLEIGNEQDYFDAAFPDLEVFWLDTSAGPDQVLLITAAALRDWSASA